MAGPTGPPTTALLCSITWDQLLQSGNIQLKGSTVMGDLNSRAFGYPKFHKIDFFQQCL